MVVQRLTDCSSHLCICFLASELLKLDDSGIKPKLHHFDLLQQIHNNKRDDAAPVGPRRRRQTCEQYKRVCCTANRQLKRSL